MGVGAGYGANFVNSGPSVKAMYTNTSGNVMRSRKMSAQGMSASESYSALAYTSDQLTEMTDPSLGQPHQPDLASDVADALKKFYGSNSSEVK